MDARTIEARRILAWLKAAKAAGKNGDAATAGFLEAEAMATLETLANAEEPLVQYVRERPMPKAKPDPTLRVPQLGEGYMADLKARMARAGITPADLARATKKSPAQLSRWFNGMVPGAANMRALEDAFHRMLEAKGL